MLIYLRRSLFRITIASLMPNIPAAPTSQQASNGLPIPQARTGLVSSRVWSLGYWIHLMFRSLRSTRVYGCITEGCIRLLPHCMFTRMHVLNACLSFGQLILCSIFELLLARHATDHCHFFFNCSSLPLSDQFRSTISSLFILSFTKSLDTSTFRLL